MTIKKARGICAIFAPQIAHHDSIQAVRFDHGELDNTDNW